MISNVILIDDCQEDGITLYSPFTGIPYFSENDVDLHSDDRHRDPSLVFCYIGDIGEFHFIRPDVSEMVNAAFHDKFREEQTLGKKVDEHDNAQDMVKEVTRIAESISTKLKTEKNLNTVTFVQTGGWNGMFVSCFEQGYLLGEEWCPLESGRK